jgi:hypothetical protein
VAKDRTTVQSPEPGVGTPPRDPSRSLDVLHTELAKIQIDGEYTKTFLAELKRESSNMRDRTGALEVSTATLQVKVDHLPSKGFIVVVVTTFLVIAGGLMTIAPKLWSWSGTAIIATPLPK